MGNLRAAIDSQSKSLCRSYQARQRRRRRRRNDVLAVIRSDLLIDSIVFLLRSSLLGYASASLFLCSSLSLSFQERINLMTSKFHLSVPSIEVRDIDDELCSPRTSVVHCPGPFLCPRCDQCGSNGLVRGEECFVLERTGPSVDRQRPSTT